MAVEIAQQTIIFSIVGVGLFILGTVILNFVMKNFIFSYLRVKSSRGRLLLLEAVTNTDNYYTTCRFEDKCLIYKTRGKKQKRITKIGKDHVESIMGVFRVKVNEELDFAYMSDGKVPPLDKLPDAEATDNMINRVLLAAGTNDPRLMWILIGVVVLILGGMVVIFMQSQAITAAKACLSLTATIR